MFKKQVKNVTPEDLKQEIKQIEERTDKLQKEHDKIKKENDENEMADIVIMAESIFDNLINSRPRGNANSLADRAFTLARAFSRKKRIFYQIRDKSRGI